MMNIYIHVFIYMYIYILYYMICIYVYIYYSVPDEECLEADESLGQGDVDQRSRAPSLFHTCLNI